MSNVQLTRCLVYPLAKQPGVFGVTSAVVAMTFFSILPPEASKGLGFYFNYTEQESPRKSWRSFSEGNIFLYDLSLIHI